MKPLQSRESRLSITIRNLQRAVHLNVADLQGFAEKAVKSCCSIRRDQATQLTRLRQISVLVISDRRMAVLHQEFLHTAGPTDVITFEHGEIFISIDTAKRHARKFRTSLEHEIHLYIVHALLHLHGFDDEKKSDARRMEATQNRILEQIAAD